MKGLILLLEVYFRYLVLFRYFRVYIRPGFFVFLPSVLISIAFLFAFYYGAVRRCGIILGVTEVASVVTVRHNAVSMCSPNISRMWTPFNSFALPVFTFLLVVTVFLYV